MTKAYRIIETSFEKLTSFATAILGNSITFIIALCTVIYWFTNHEFFSQSIHESLRDVIHGVTFLSLFIIQKEFNRFSGSLHLKVNELVLTHKPANSALVNIESKTEHEIIELSKEYEELAVQIKDKTS